MPLNAEEEPHGLYAEVHYAPVDESDGTSGLMVDDVDEPLEDEEWMATAKPLGIRLRVPTLVLLALGVAAGGFWGGSVAQRHQSSSSAASSLASRFAALRGSGAFGGSSSGFGGAGFGGSAATPAAAGTIVNVTSSEVDLTNTSGALVKVTLGATTTVSRTGVGSPGALQIGDTATVRGTVGSDGTVAATAIVATASGVSASTGGSGSGAGFPGGGLPTGG